MHVITWLYLLSLRFPSRAAGIELHAFLLFGSSLSCLRSTPKPFPFEFEQLMITSSNTYSVLMLFWTIPTQRRSAHRYSRKETRVSLLPCIKIARSKKSGLISKQKNTQIADYLLALNFTKLYLVSQSTTFDIEVTKYLLKHPLLYFIDNAVVDPDTTTSDKAYRRKAYKTGRHSHWSCSRK